MKNIIRLFHIAFAASLLSCYSTEVSDSGNIKQSEIHMDYYCEFNAENNVADARAIFRFESWKGNTLRLTPPSSITVNNAEMEGEKEWLTGFVYRSRKMKPTQEFIFHFTDTDNKEYNNKIVVPKIEIKDIPKSIQKSKSLKLYWEGNPLGKGETIRFHLQMNDTLQISIDNKIKDSKYIEIKPNDLQNMVPGMANIWMERYVNKSLDESTHIGGNLSGTYCSEKRGIEITE